MSSSLTFVTCFLDAYEETGILDTNPQKQLPERIARFRQLAATGIQICLYTTANLKEWIEPIVQEFPTIHWTILSIQDTFIWKTVNEDRYSLPENRSAVKDNAEFMVVQNCKAELIERAIIENPWNSTHFAWIDFSIFYVFHNPAKSAKWLQILSTLQLAPKFITFPGCKGWAKLAADNVANHLLHRVYWRFCGGFFIGDKDSLWNFTQLYRTHFPLFMDAYRRIVWEVNFWAWLEATAGWLPTMFNADHNDSILQFTADYYTESITCESSTQKFIKEQYKYPALNTYQPSSASYIEWGGQRILNTRYVNYLLYDNGAYHIHSPDGRTLDTKNVLSILDDQWQPLGYDFIEESVELTDYLPRAKRFVSRGFEDIRLYACKEGGIRFIATTIQYSPLGQNRMVLGEYDVAEKRLHSAGLIEPPNPDVWCEKNWIPIPYGDDQEDHFIYSWSPFQVGKVVAGGATHPEFPYKMEIVLKREYPDTPFLNHIRGSTVFVPYGEERMIGLVHFSEEYVPRHYYHMMIQLNKDTLEIVAHSQPFLFQSIGIEFCIGFTIDNESSFHYWISQMDRNPLHLTIPEERFRWYSVYNQ